MREIKFEYIYSNGKDFIKKSFTLEEISNGECYEFLSDMPMYKDYKLITYRQNTGLKDKNGIDIFEGDIIEYPSFEDYYTEENGMQEKTIYKNYELYQDKYGAYKLKGWDNGMTWEDYSDQPILNIGKVIGNIYENSNLLTNQI